METMGDCADDGLVECSVPAEESFCEMSGGPCSCDVAPGHRPKHMPEAPMPRTERESTTAVPIPSTRLVEYSVRVPELRRENAAWFGVNAGRTHNEIQALLGVWQA